MMKPFGQNPPQVGAPVAPAQQDMSGLFAALAGLAKKFKSRPGQYAQGKVPGIYGASGGYGGGASDARYSSPAVPTPGSRVPHKPADDFAGFPPPAPRGGQARAKAPVAVQPQPVTTKKKQPGAFEEAICGPGG